MRAAWLVLLAGCGGAEGPGPDATERTPPAPLTPDVAAEGDAAYVPLAAPRLLRRMSLDLRGVLPTVEELDAVEADPAQIAAIRDGWLADPRLEERLVDLLSERWQTEPDSYLISYWEYPSLNNSPVNEYPFERSIGQEPLRLMARIITDERPWPEIVSADWTMSNGLLAGIWPIDRPDGAEGTEWQVSRYTDGRPAVGVLATGGLWWRYYTTISNRNRGRAAAISRLLLCEDYLARPVTLSGDVALADAAGLEAALTSNPYCQGCHSSLDPVAATFFGFWGGEYSAIEQATYHPEREPLGADLLGVEPSWYGSPVSGLAELGWYIADDPRFARCAAQSFAEQLWRRESSLADEGRIEALRQHYLANGEQIWPLIQAITDGPTYQAAGLSSDGSAEMLAREETMRLLNAPLIRSVFADLFGFSWDWYGFDQLDNDTYGFRAMAGGVDGSSVTRPQRRPGLTWALVLERYGQAAARYFVDGGLDRGILSGVTAALLPGSAGFDAALDRLHWQLYAVRAEPEWRADIGALWSGVQADAGGGQPGAEAAWAAVLAVMVQDPLFAQY